MLDADKENCPPATAAATTPKSSFAATHSAKSSLSTTPTKAPLGPASLAFPADDPDEDRDVLASDGKTLRSRRSVLFYPSATLAAKSNQQPFSRSAAKRESILALGSIGYLQHLYTKQGIASRNRPVMKGAMTLAIGPAGEAMMSSSAGDPSDNVSDTSTNGRTSGHVQIIEEEEESHVPELPPSPKAGTYTRPKFLDVARPLEADAQALRTLLAVDLSRLSRLWELSDWIATDPTVASIKQVLSECALQTDDPIKAPNASSVDLLAVIDATTKAIRSVRSYILALPQRSRIPTTSPNEPNGRDRYKRQSSFSGVSRPGQVGTPVPTRTSEILHHDLNTEDVPDRGGPLHALSAKIFSGRRSSYAQGSEDIEHLSILRKAALEMLSALKVMEERSRVEMLEIHGATEQDVPTSLENGDSTTSSEADESNISLFSNGSSAVGYLYRSDLKLSDLTTERRTLQDYLKTVASVLSASTLPSSNDRRTSSSGMAAAQDVRASTSTVQADNGAPPSLRLDSADAYGLSYGERSWTVPGLSKAERLSGFIIDHCEACIGQNFDGSRMDRLHGAEDDLDSLLPLLSDGYLLCRVFNEAVRRSDKPWGYISSREMHDLEAEEAALLHKEALRLKQAQEAEALNFQTRANCRSTSEGDASVNETEPPCKSVEMEASSSRPGWTFRRTENLRVWATALKLRYHIQTTATKATPAKPAATGPTYGSLGLGKLALHGRRAASESHASPSVVQHGTSRTIDFDPAKVARREEGWQDMLTQLLTAWVDAVADDRHGVNASS